MTKPRNNVLGSKTHDERPTYLDEEQEVEDIHVGPDHYEPDVKLIKKQGRTANFGYWGASKNERFKDKPSTNPGPGEYGSEHAMSISLAQMKLRD